MYQQQLAKSPAGQVRIQYNPLARSLNNKDDVNNQAILNAKDRFLASQKKKTNDRILRPTNAIKTAFF
jgi:hypothetical protein